MLKIRTGALVLLAIVAAATAWLSIGTGRPASAQTPATTDTVVKVEGPITKVKEGDLNIPFKVSVENVKNLDAFQFQLTFDAHILEYVSVQKGPFLGSTGRTVQCVTPEVDSGVFRISCPSLGPTPPGPDGSGELATVFFKAKGSGTTDIALDRVKLIAVAETAPEIPVARVDGTSLKVQGTGGLNWMIWGPVIGVVALIVVGGGAFMVMKRSGGAKSVSAA